MGTYKKYTYTLYTTKIHTYIHITSHSLRGVGRDNRALNTSSLTYLPCLVLYTFIALVIHACMDNQIILFRFRPEKWRESEWSSTRDGGGGPFYDQFHKHFFGWYTRNPPMECLIPWYTLKLLGQYFVSFSLLFQRRALTSSRPSVQWQFLWSAMLNACQFMGVLYWPNTSAPAGTGVAAPVEAILGDL